MIINGVRALAYFYNVLVLQFTEKFDLAYGRHVKAILELPDFDFLYGNFPTSRNLPP